MDITYLHLYFFIWIDISQLDPHHIPRQLVIVSSIANFSALIQILFVFLFSLLFWFHYSFRSVSSKWDLEINYSSVGIDWKNVLNIK